MAGLAFQFLVVLLLLGVCTFVAGRYLKHSRLRLHDLQREKEGLSFEHKPHLKYGEGMTRLWEGGETGQVTPMPVVKNRLNMLKYIEDPLADPGSLKFAKRWLQLDDAIAAEQRRYSQVILVGTASVMLVGLGLVVYAWLLAFGVVS